MPDARPLDRKFLRFIVMLISIYQTKGVSPGTATGGTGKTPHSNLAGTKLSAEFNA
jgi:hypothetical protein